jgi:hypothetical protein
VKEDERNPTRMVQPIFGKIKLRCGFFQGQPAGNGVSSQIAVKMFLNVVVSFHFAIET